MRKCTGFYTHSPALIWLPVPPYLKVVNDIIGFVIEIPVTGRIPEDRYRLFFVPIQSPLMIRLPTPPYPGSEVGLPPATANAVYPPREWPGIKTESGFKKIPQISSYRKTNWYLADVPGSRDQILDSTLQVLLFRLLNRRSGMPAIKPLHTRWWVSVR